jgi:hypothetical protein
MMTINALFISMLGYRIGYNSGMEYLTFNSGSQWTLCKAATPYASPEGGISTPRIQGEPGNAFRSYRSTNGQLREDNGTKGSVHGNPGNKRAPKQGMPLKHQGKPAQLLPSSAANSEPGLGV